MPTIHTRPVLLGILGTNLLALDSIPLCWHYYYPALRLSQDPEVQPQRQLVEVKTTVLRMSSDTQTAQQDHTVHLEAAVTNLVRRTYRWHIQGAGGRRCELEGSIWEVGSSDGAAPEPIGLRVVILLGWPRSVRVMVVGTFKPDAWLEI